ncbi:MAG: hypothetical protein RL113_85 [Pseudomonadota bacterium]|jgi:hypothetical protein
MQENKMMKKLLCVLAVSSLMIITGCGDDPTPKKKMPVGFHTERGLFFNVPDKKAPTKKMRNALIDEFIQKSNIQCRQYLNDPLIRAASRNQSNSEIYSSMFDNVSQLVGTKGITDGAKSLYSKGDREDPYKTKMAYERALSPEIIRSVEITRERYARKIRSNKYRLIESYTLAMLEQDMQSYDRLCNYETGLMEINRILQQASKPKKSLKPFPAKQRIDPDTIKNTSLIEKQEGDTTSRTIQNEEIELKTAKVTVNIWESVDNNMTQNPEKDGTVSDNLDAK